MVIPSDIPIFTSLMSRLPTFGTTGSERLAYENSINSWTLSTFNFKLHYHVNAFFHLIGQFNCCAKCDAFQRYAINC